MDEVGAFQSDVIVFHIGLPTLHGHEASRRIRAQSWGTSVVLIDLIGWEQDDDCRRSRDAAFDHHLVKPVDPQTLMTLRASVTRAKE